MAAAPWLDGVGGAQAPALRTAWLEALATDGTRLGSGKSLVGALNALPRPLPASPAFPLRQILESGLVPPGGQAEVLRALQGATGDSPAAFARRYGETFVSEWDNTLQTEVAAAVTPLVAANASPKELLVKMAELLTGDRARPPAMNVALLEEAGVLNAADAQALTLRLRELATPRVP
jgi:hypothetical protein